MGNVNRFLLDGRTYNMEDAGARQGIANLTRETTDGVALLKTLAERRNILHNWEFRNPVNQQGREEYAGRGYGIDRWVNSSPLASVSTVNVGPNGLVLTSVEGNAWLVQRVEFPPLYSGLTVTLSADVESVTGRARVALWDGGSFVPGGFVDVNEGTTGIVSLTVTLPVFAGSFSFALEVPDSGSIAVRRVKLEPGSVSTLANDPPACLATELALCQRFQVTNFSWQQWAGNAVEDNAAIRFFIPLPVTMRIAPTVQPFDVFVCSASGGAAAARRLFTPASVLRVPNGVRLQGALCTPLPGLGSWQNLTVNNQTAVSLDANL